MPSPFLSSTPNPSEPRPKEAVNCLTTTRFQLRRLIPDDASWLAALDTDPDVMRYIREPSTPGQALADAQARITWDLLHPTLGLWAIEDGTTTPGWVGLKPFNLCEDPELYELELGFRLIPTSWGQGIAHEAGARILEYGFKDLRLPRILGVAHIENAASNRVLAKLGFLFERRIEHWNNYERTTEQSTLPAAQ